MKIETNPRDDQQVQIIAEFDSEELERYMHRAARKISQETKIPGFRPGKAPYEHIRRIYGEDALQKQAVELLVDDVYPEVLKQAEVEPSGPGSLENIISINPPKLSFLIPLMPEVILGDYHAIRKSYDQPQVTDEEIQKVMQDLRNNYATAEPADDRPAQEGDMVASTISAEFVTPAEGEKAEFFRKQPLQVIINDDTENQWPYQGFAQNLVGMSVNDEKDIPYTYPADSQYTKLAGKDVVFHVSIQSIKAMKYPELNDEFATTLGAFDTIEEVHKMVQDQLEKNHQQEYDQGYLNGLVDEIVSASTVKYPPNMLDEEIEHLIKHLEEDLAENKMDMETYLKSRQMEREAFIDAEVKPAAVKRLARSLVLDQLAREENIRLEKDELETAVTASMREMMNSKEYSQFKSREAQKNLANAVTYETASRLINQHLMERLKAIATGTYKEEVEAPTAELTAAELSNTVLTAAEQPEVAEQPAADAQPVAEQPASEEKPAAEDSSAASKPVDPASEKAEGE